MRNIIAIIACGVAVFGYTQNTQDTTKTVNLDEIVINTQRLSKNKKTISQQIESFSKNEIEFGNFQTTADLFQNTGTLAVQKSQQGGGSPVIRGFESSRVLLVIDGIRMNNLIYRTGHLQNSITVDKNMLEGVDILFGPSSTLYGSDALGGAIVFKTKDAKTLENTANIIFSGNVISNYSTINQGKMLHADFNYANKNWASLTSFSFNEYGDLKMGRNPNRSNAKFGERPFYIQNINGIDTAIANDNPFIQKFSGYTQYDFMQKFVLNQSNGLKHNINLHYSTTTDIPRYDRLTDLTSAGKLKSAVWNYGPQKRLLAGYTVSKDKVFLNSDLKITASYQNVEESRITRNVNNPNLSSRIEKVSVFGLNTDFKTKIGKAEFIYGIDVFYENLKSIAFNTNIFTGIEGLLDSRYPNGKNNTFSIEGFAMYNHPLNNKFAYNASLRSGYKELNSNIERTTLNLPYDAVNQKNFTYSGAIGLTHNPSQKVKLAVNLASAFRVPNVDDLSKIFDTSNGALIVPNNDLKPEKTVTADFAISFYENKVFQLENNFFFTRMFDPIITDNFTLNGQSTILYNGFLSNITANQNQGIANITGLSSNLKLHLLLNLVFNATVNIIKGTISNNKTSAPLDHIAPAYGKIGFAFEGTKLSLDAFMLYSAKKNLKEYSPSGEDNLVYAAPGGTPAWETYNLKAAYKLKNINLYSGIENILDTQYRTFASGINAAGRNFYVGIKYNF